MPKLKPHDCFHYPVQDMDRLYALNGYSFHETMSFIPNLNTWKDIGGTNILNNVDSYASFARIRNYIWVAGGLGTCKPFTPNGPLTASYQVYKGSHQSYLWKMDKKKWIKGPILKKSFRFVKGKNQIRVHILRQNYAISDYTPPMHWWATICLSFTSQSKILNLPELSFLYNICFQSWTRFRLV